MNEMNKGKLDLNLLTVFDAVHMTGSVTRAAARLNLSQPAVSHALRRLRALTGDPLFVRSGGGLTPTPRAELIAGGAAQVISTARALLAKPSFDPDKDARSFRIASSDYSSLTLAPLLAQSLRRQAPRCALELVSVGTGTLRQLAAGEADCSFWGVAAPEGPFKAVRLFDEHLIMAVDRAHPLACRLNEGAGALSTYAACPHAAVAHGASTPNPLDAALKKAGVERRAGLTAPSFAACIAAAKGTDLIVTLPSRLAAYAEAQNFVCFDLPFACEAYPYFLVWHERTAADPAQIWLRRLIVRAAGGAG